MKWWNRMPKPDWLYMGHVTLRYVDDKDKTLESCSVHFFVDKNDLSRRRIEHSSWSTSKIEGHGYWQKYIYPWLQNENLWSVLSGNASFIHPSEQLKEWTKEQNGYTYNGNRWIAPKSYVEGHNNVVVLPIKK